MFRILCKLKDRRMFSQWDLMDVKTMDDLVGKEGLIRRVTRNLSEQLLRGEFAHRLGYEPLE
ncbi:MAG: hypothetical protein J7K33_01415 [Candidatus Marinimicrobia bacterium]|nr:hypothetical protein [Candidatus Neomarinimicrobiota bacterium]